MRKYVVTTLLFAVFAFATDRSALNGTWTLVPAKSDFQGQPVVQTGTVTISDHQGVTVISRSFVYEGAAETFFYSDSTGSSEYSPTIHSGKDLKTKTKWDHDVLKVTTTLSGAVTRKAIPWPRMAPCRSASKGRRRKPFTLVFQRQ